MVLIFYPVLKMGFILITDRNNKAVTLLDQHQP